jgi:hypothetical protein
MECFKWSLQLEKKNFRKGSETINPTEDIVEMPKIDSLDVLEWTMELRENKIMMDLHNLKVKEKKIKDIEESERQMRQRESEKIEEVLNIRRQDILDQQQCLKEKEAEINERRAILAKAQFNIMRQREIEECEREVARRQTNLEARELQLEEKNRILEIAIRVNETRRESDNQRRNSRSPGQITTNSSNEEIDFSGDENSADSLDQSY